MQENTEQQITPSLSEEAINKIIEFLDTKSLRQFRLVDKKSYILASGRFFQKTIETHRFSSQQHRIFNGVIDQSFDSNKSSTNELLACLLQPNMRYRVGINIEDAMQLAVQFKLHDTVIKLLSEEEKPFIKEPEYEIVSRNGGTDCSQTDLNREDAIERQKFILIEFLNYVKSQLITLQKMPHRNRRDDVVRPIDVMIKRRRTDIDIRDALLQYSETDCEESKSPMELAIQYELHDVVIELLSKEENPFTEEPEYEIVSRNGGTDCSQTEENCKEAVEEQKFILRQLLNYSKERLIALQEIQQNSFETHNDMDVRNALLEDRESGYSEDNNNPVRLGL